MAGHSKWNNIKRKKEAEDAKRGKVFTKLSNTITTATKQGGDDPNTNPTLRLAISKAKEANMPKDKIEAAIKKASDTSLAGEEVTYEFYGPSGVAFIVKCLTDNKNRTAANLKAILNKHNIQLANPGSASYLFNSNGEPTYKPPLGGADLQKVQKIVEDLEQLEELEDILTNA